MIELAVQNGISRDAYRSRIKRGWSEQLAATKTPRTSSTGTEEYVVYRGEEFICIGTLQECADHMGLSIKTMKFYTFPVYYRRIAERKNARNYITVTRLEDDDE